MKAIDHSKKVPLLKLSGTLTYSFYGSDSEADACIKALTSAMSLQEGPGAGREIIVYTANKRQVNRRILIPDDGSAPILCAVEKADNFVLLGRVISARRNNKTRQIYGGRQGIINMCISRSNRKANHLLQKLFSNCYHFLSGRGIFINKLFGIMDFRIVVFQRYSLVYPKIILKGKTIGTYDFKSNSWKIKRPYRLFIAENSLPDFESPLKDLINKKPLNI